ncbi:MAG TPA: aminomethyl transferase family protein [Microbacterium sp.]|uniref:aminomethyl transferase family protein n=1 Tax=Microbacterium sp. TaxID=51671 RepID=UPI002BA418AC|nr:aminomethyl transferase family protein [Microbacterium sp.]HWI32290.1 aminomethyl transferase family protein [Microbacterium sp.]
MSLQDAIDQAENPLEFIRANNFDVRGAFAYPAEYTNWRDEQRAWAETAVLFNQSFHMEDVFISGPDMLRLLSDTSVNSFANFRPGIAKQFIAVNEEGQLFGDAILVALSDSEVNIVGREWALNWLRYQAEKGDYDVTIETEPAIRGAGGSKRLYRYEVEGPNAEKILQKASGEDFPHIKFFNTGILNIAGHEVWALNHTMGGVPGQEFSGYEIFGPTEDEDDVINAILAAGEEHGLLRGGARAYLSAGIESGWMGATGVPAVYASESLKEYREWLPAFTIEAVSVGVASGSYDPATVEGYFCNPWDHGFGHVVKFDHDFIGRKALEELAKNPPRQKVWLVWNPEDTERIVVQSELDHPNAPKILPFPSDVGHDQILIGDRPVGVTAFHGYTVNLGGWASLASVNTADAVDGTEVEILWGDRDGGARNPLVPMHTQTRIRARVSVKSPIA